MLHSTQRKMIEMFDFDVCRYGNLFGDKGPYFYPLEEQSAK